MQPEVLSDEDKNRFILVEWAEEKKGSYVATLTIESEDRPGMIMAVSTILADLGINCVSVAARVNKDKLATMTIGLEISDIQDIKKASNKIKQIPGVINVSRTKN